MAPPPQCLTHSYYTFLVASRQHYRTREDGQETVKKRLSGRELREVALVRLRKKMSREGLFRGKKRIR